MKLTEEQIENLTNLIMEEIKGGRPWRRRKEKPVKTKPDYTMFGQGNVNMMRANGKDIALPELIKIGSYVGYNYHPKQAVNPIIGNGYVTDSKPINDGKTAYKIEGEDGKVIWVPGWAITTIQK